VRVLVVEAGVSDPGIAVDHRTRLNVLADAGMTGWDAGFPIFAKWSSVWACVRPNAMPDAERSEPRSSSRATRVHKMTDKPGRRDNHGHLRWPGELVVLAGPA
jgi:hypothetical protein